MKIVHCVERFPPEPTGGLQVHLCDLAPHLRQRGVTPVVAASIDGPSSSEYEYAGMEVFRYPVHPPYRRLGSGQRGEPHGGFDQFARWLERQDVQIYGQHRWSTACGPDHLRHASRLGLPTVVHVHIPEPLCARGTLMLQGSEQCDGRILLDRCSECLGAPRVARFASRFTTGGQPTGVVASALHQRAQSLPGPLRSAASRLLAPGWAPAQVAEKKEWFDEMADVCDAIVVMSSWTVEAFVANGVHREMLHLIPYGTSPAPTTHRVPSPDGALRVGFIGRMHPDKGVEFLVRAVRRLHAGIPVRLVLHTVPADDRYEATVRDLAEGDPRIRFAGPFGRDEQAAVYSHLDVVAVPSQWLETGPLVVLEAHAHGVPVLGADLGGISERVENGIDGLLISHGDEEAWATALRRLATEAGLLDGLRRGVRPAVRTLDGEADDLARLYTHLAR